MRHLARELGGHQRLDATTLAHQVGTFYKDLQKSTGDAPKWNFHKYLIGRDGRTVSSFGSRTTPDDKALVAAIEAAIASPAKAPGKAAAAKPATPAKGSR